MKRLICLVLALAITVSMFCGCGFSIDPSINYLQGKYNTKFKIISSNNAKTYCSPIENEKIIFEVTKNNKNFSDSYISRKISYELDNCFCSAMQAFNVAAVSYSMPINTTDSGENDTSISLKEYIEKYKPDGFFVYLAIDNNVITSETVDNLADSIEIVLKQIEKPITVCGFIVGDFFQCSESIKKCSDMSSTWFYNYDVKDTFSATVSPGNSIESLEMLKNNILERKTGISSRR